MSQTSDFNISFRSLSVQWRMLVLSMVVGGLLGLFVAMIRPPRYLATGVLDVGIDFNRTHSLSRIAQQHALERVRALLLSDEILDATVIAIQQRDPAIDFDGIWDLRSRIKLGEIGSQWTMSAVDENPETAVIIASSWVEVSLEAIDSALRHAVRAADIQNDYYSLGCKLIAAPETEMALWQCQGSEKDPVQLEAALREEAARAHGLLPAMSFSLISDVGDSVPKVTAGRGTWILMGMFTGFVLSLGAILFKN
jgi:hypothetical protein